MSAQPAVHRPRVPRWVHEADVEPPRDRSAWRVAIRRLRLIRVRRRHRYRAGRRG